MANVARLTYPLDSDAKLTIGLVDDEAAPINGATVNITLYKDRNRGVEVPGVAWPQTMHYVADSAGVYTLELSADMNTNLNQVLSMVGRVVTLAGKRLRFIRDVSVADA